MAWLTAILAFATTMLMLAMLVSTLVEMVHRIFGLRVRSLRKLLENFFNYTLEGIFVLDKSQDSNTQAPGKAEISQFVEFIITLLSKILIIFQKGKDFAASILLGDGIESSQESKEFANNMRYNRGSGQTETPVYSGHFRRLDSMSLPVFMQRLATLGEFKVAEDKLNDLAADIAQKFEAFGQEMSEAFERRARLMSVIIAIAIAFLFNVDPLHIARTYLDEPERAAAVAEKAGDLVKQLEADEKARAEKAKAEKEKAEPGATGTGEAGGAPASGDAAKDAAAEEQELVGALKAFQAKIDAERLPLGWASSDAAGKPLPKCISWWPESGCVWTFAGIKGQWPPLAKWPLLLMGGLLVGLGAPYWAKVVSSLLALRDGSQKIAEIVTPAMRAADGTPQSAAVAAFMTAFKAKAATKQNNKIDAVAPVAGSHDPQPDPAN